MVEVRSDMAGIVFLIKVEPGDEVAPGQPVVVLESMKMEISVASRNAGVVKEITVQCGDVVDEGDLLMLLECQSLSTA